MEYKEFNVTGAGTIHIGQSPNCMCGNNVGFDFSVSWGKYGNSGGMIDRDEAKKLADHIYEILNNTRLKSKYQVQWEFTNYRKLIYLNNDEIYFRHNFNKKDNIYNYPVLKIICKLDKL